MAVSYLSKVYESNPYILPVDLNLLAKVNGYRQGLFYQNANSLRQQFSALKNSDILNPQQKAVLDEKYNNLSNSVNSWGGVDYSDMGIVSQIEGMAADIYSDPTVLNGIASTKKIRTLMGNYEKMKTDPKLMKYYNKGNEAYDMRAVNSYISGDAGATYSGSTAPTIYKGNPYTILTEKLKVLKPNVEVHFNEVTGNPYFIEKTKNEILSPERVYADMEGHIDADVMGQIRIDAWYNMQGVDNTKLEDMYVKQHESKLENYNHLLAQYDKDLKLAVTDEKKKSIEAEKSRIQGYIAAANESYDLAGFRKKLNGSEEDNINAKAGLYLNKLFDDGVKANSYNKIDKSLQVNYAQLAQDKREIALLQMENARYIAAMRASSKKGEGQGVDAQGNPLLFGDIAYNTQELKELEENEELTIDKIVKDNIDQKAEIGRILNDFIVNNADFEQESTDKKNYLNLGEVDKLQKRLGQIATLDLKKGLSLEDIKLYMNSTTLRANEKEKKFFQNTIDAFEQAALGNFSAIKDMKISKSNFKSVYEQYADKQDRIAGNEKLLQMSNEKALENFSAAKKLSASEKALVDEFIKNPTNYIEVKQATSYSPQFGTTTSTFTEFKPGNENMEKALRKAGVTTGTKPGEPIFVNNSYLDNIKEEQNKILKDQSFRQNYYSLSLNHKELNKESSQFQSLVATKLGGDVDVESVNLLQISQMPTSSEQYKQKNTWKLDVQYKNAKGTVVGGVVYLTDQQASGLGVDANTRMDLETTLLRKGELTPRFMTNDVWEDNGVFKIQVDRPGGKDGQIRVLVANGNEYIKLTKWQDNNGNFRPFTTATQAMEVMKLVIGNAHNVFPNREAFVEKLLVLQSK